MRIHSDGPDPLHSDVDVEPMTPEHFELTVSTMSFQSAATVRAARAVLVDFQRNGDASAANGIPAPQVSRAVQRIQQKWQAICARENWVCEPVVLAPEAMAVVRGLEAKTLEPLKKRLQSKASRRKPSGS